jgi:hypothetical protein
MHQKNKFFSLSSLGYKSTYLIQIAVLLYLLRSAMYFSGNFEQTQMRLIDDYAMQFSIYTFHNEVLNLNLNGILFKYDYAYGWLFWFVFGIVTIPFFLLYKYIPNLPTEQLLIISVRSVNIILLFILFRLLARIIHRILFNKLKFTDIISNLLATAIILTPTFGYWAGRPMPPILAATIFTLGVYIGVEKRNIEARKLFLLSAVFGLAVGVKVNYIIYVPLFILVIAEIRRVIYGNDKIRFKFNKVAFKMFLSFLVGGIFGTSPALLFSPLQGFPKIFEIFNLFRSLSVSEQIGTPKQFLDNFINGIVLSGFGPMPQLAIIFFLLYVIFEKFLHHNKKQNSNLFITISVYILVCEIFLSYLLGLGTQYIQSYSLPIILILPIYFSIFLSAYAFNKRKLSISIMSFLILSVSNFIYTLEMNNSSFPTIYAYQYMYKEARSSGTFELQRKMQSEIKLGNTSIEIIQDYSLPTAWSGFRDQVSLTYAYNDWEKKSLSLGRNDLYLFIDKKYRTFDDRGTSKNSSLIQSPSDQIVGRLVLDQSFLGRSCQIRSNNARYLLYICVASKQ